MTERFKPDRFIPDVLRGQTYLRLAYLLLGFPLGLVYVLSLLFGLLAGIVLTLIGSPVLIRVAIHIWNLADLERMLALRLTGVDIPIPREERFDGTMARARALLERTVFWKSLAFVVLKPLLGAATTAASTLLWLPSLIILTGPIHRSERFNMNTFDGGPPPLVVVLIGFVMVSVAARITNFMAPKVAEVARFALTDTQIESVSQHQRLEALALASRAASLASGVGAKGNLDMVLESILNLALGAVEASAGALLLGSRQVRVGFAAHEWNGLLETRVLEGDTGRWRSIRFARALVVSPKQPHAVPWQALAVLPIGEGEMRLLARFDQSTPRKNELEFLATIADQIGVALENARLIALAQGQAALEERHKLARELHDSVSQALYGIALGARTAKTQLTRDPSKAHEPLEYVLQLAEAGVTEMRALIFELRPEHLERDGLIAALQQQAEMMRLRYHLETETQFDAEPNWPLEVKQALLRIAQEALHNTVKHARAKRAHLRLQGRTLEIRDDGMGFEASDAFDGRYGQRTMRERAEAIRARFDLETTPGQGTCIRVTLPND